MAAGLSFDRTITRLWAARRGAGGSAVSVFGVRVAAAGFAFLAQVLMARLMGGVEYGLFAGIWVWVALLGHAATLGFSQGACRFLPARVEHGAVEVGFGPRGAGGYLVGQGG